MDCDNLHNIKRCMAPGKKKKKKHQPTGVLNTARVYSLTQKLGFQSYLVSVRFRHFLFGKICVCTVHNDHISLSGSHAVEGNMVNPIP